MICLLNFRVWQRYLRAPDTASRRKQNLAEVYLSALVRAILALLSAVARLRAGRVSAAPARALILTPLLLLVAIMAARPVLADTIGEPQSSAKPTPAIRHEQTIPSDRRSGSVSSIVLTRVDIEADDVRGTAIIPHQPRPLGGEYEDGPFLVAQESPTALLVPGAEFDDCAGAGWCPTMVVVPKGTFMMGSPREEENHWDDEGPQHKVTIAAPFAVGKYEVTFNEWDACVAENVCANVDDLRWGRGRRPVFNVTWTEAEAYIGWLGRKTKKPYRLLSEAEWEYAARGGTTTPFWTGASISTEQANYAGNYTSGSDKKSVYRKKTVAVDDPTFPANPFGLYHVHGNITEWVEDCYHDSYKGAPADGSAWITGDCWARVLRGGSWAAPYPGYVRAAGRFIASPTSGTSLRGSGSPGRSPYEGLPLYCSGVRGRSAGSSFRVARASPGGRIPTGLITSS